MLHHFLNLLPLDGSLVATDTVSMKILSKYVVQCFCGRSFWQCDGWTTEYAHLDGMLDAASCHLRCLGYFTLLPTVYKGPVALHTHSY